MKYLFKFAICLILFVSCFSPNKSVAQDVFYLTADCIFDGEKMLVGKAVIVKGNKIQALVEKSVPIPSGARRSSPPPRGFTRWAIRDSFRPPHSPRPQILKWVRPLDF
jgi:hypothetical protein